MANELKTVVDFSFSKSGAKIAKTYSENTTVTGDSYVSGILSIGTSEEELTQLADLGTPGEVLLKNLDSTNYIEIGATTGVYTIKLKAGKWAKYFHDSATIYAKANTGACLLDYTIIEE
jgi:hypothetical protein